MKNKSNISVKNNLGTRVTPSIILGESINYPSGDILDANATLQLLDSGSKSGISIVNVASGTSSIAAEENTHYNVAGSVTSLTVTLPTIEDTEHLQFVTLNLTTGSNPTITFSSEDNAVISYFTDYTIEDDTEYELNCMFNGTKWIIGYGTIG